MCKKCNCEECSNNNTSENTNNWYIPLLMIMLNQSFNTPKLLNRQAILEEINRSELSTSEKKQIIEILLS